jgi:hypothetical protein
MKVKINQLIQNYGVSVNLGQNLNMTFGHQRMLVGPLLKDINLKVVNGRRNQKRNKSMEHLMLFEEFSLLEEKKSKGGLDKWFKEKWVDISKTNADGSHPPCGREDADKGGYPKCRKVRVAAKMSKKEKKNSVTRKRRAEKGKGGSNRKPNYSK